MVGSWRRWVDDAVADGRGLGAAIPPCAGLSVLAPLAAASWTPAPAPRASSTSPRRGDTAAGAAVGRFAVAKDNALKGSRGCTTVRAYRSSGMRGINCRGVA